MANVEFRPSPDFLRGVTLFNRMAFFEAHEMMEVAWQAEPGARRLFYQGVLQLSVAWYHLQKSNLIGAKKVLAKAEKNLASFPERYLEFNLLEIRQQIYHLQQAIAQAQMKESSINFEEWVGRYFCQIFPAAEGN